MDNVSQTTGLADAQRRLQELREAEARQAAEQRAKETKQKEDDRKLSDGSAAPDTQAAERKADAAKEDGDLQDDRRQEDDRKHESRLADDRRKEDDRKKERQNEERSSSKEEGASNEVALQGRADEPAQGAREDNSLSAQVARMNDGQDKGRAQTSEQTVSRPASMNVLNPNDLAASESKQNSPRPAGERAESAQITPEASKAEREHFRQGKENEMVSRTAMRNSLEREKNTSQGNVRPSAETQEFAAKAEGRLEQESVKSQERLKTADTAKKPELTQ